MARININLSDVLNERLRTYANEKGITLTSIIEHALIAYFYDLELKEKMEGLLTAFFKESSIKTKYDLEQKKGEQASESVKEKANF